MGESRHRLLAAFLGARVGWYAMAIVDVLDYMPVDHPPAGGDSGDFRPSHACRRRGARAADRAVVSGARSRGPRR